MTPFIVVFDASSTSSEISSYVAALLSLTVKSTTDTLTVGTLKAIPVSFPFNSGITKPTALAAPVELGMILSPPALPSLQFLALGPSTEAYPPVTAWIVVISPSLIPHLSLTILANGAKQFVVHEAFETIFISEVNLS